MTAWGLAWRTVVRDPTRVVLAVAGVAVIGALLFNMLLLSRGLLLSFRALLDSGGYDVRVVADEGFPTRRSPVSRARALADAIGKLPEVEKVALFRTDTAAAVVPGRPQRGVAFVGSTDGAVQGGWDLVKGTRLPPATPPGDPPPLIVSTRLASVLGLEPGSPLRIRGLLKGTASALPFIECRVVGIGNFRFDGADDETVATTMEGFQAVYGSGAPGDDGTRMDEADMVLVASKAAAGPDAAAAAIARLRPDLRVYSNEQVLARFTENGFSYFRQISTVLSAMTLAFAFLLVATLLTMSVNQRLGEVAALRALGFPRRRIAAGLLCESALLVGAGGACSLPLGGILAFQLDALLRTMPGLPQQIHFFVFEPRALLLHGALMVATGVLAALYPIWLAARLPIAATLRRETVS